MRTEKGLLLKDWGLLKSQGKGIIYVMIGGAALMVGALNNSVIDREESAACFGIYITVTMAIYVANMLAYDEMDHGFQYLFSLPVTKKDYVREKYIFSFIMTACGWCIGMICAGIMVLINPEEVFDLEMLAMELITFFVFQAIAGIMIAIRIRFEGEKGRIVLPIAILIIFAICYTIGFFVKANLGLKEIILHVIGGIGDLEIAIALIVLSLLIWFASYKYSMSAMKKKEF